jgi:hypothetical protein
MKKKLILVFVRSLNEYKTLKQQKIARKTEKMMNLSNISMDMVLEIFEYYNPYTENMKKNVLKINNEKNFKDDFIVEDFLRQFLKKVREDVECDLNMNDIEYNYEKLHYLSEDDIKIYVKIKDWERYDEEYAQELIEYGLDGYFVINSMQNYTERYIERLQEYLWTIQYDRLDEMVGRRLKTSKKVFDNMIASMGEDANDIVLDMISGFLDEEELYEALAILMEDINAEQGAEFLDGKNDNYSNFEDFKKLKFVNNSFEYGSEFEIITYSIDKYVYDRE